VRIFFIFKVDEQNLLPIWNAKMGEEETVFGYHDDSYGNEFVFWGVFTGDSLVLVSDIVVARLNRLTLRFRWRGHYGAGWTMRYSVWSV
jgi:hypothetical protein